MTTTGSDLCPVCKAAFTPAPGRAQRYCSPPCAKEGARRRNQAYAQAKKRWQQGGPRKDDLEGA